jgi:hypothetical protein
MLVTGFLIIEVRFPSTTTFVKASLGIPEVLDFVLSFQRIVSGGRLQAVSVTSKMIVRNLVNIPYFYPKHGI